MTKPLSAKGADARCHGRGEHKCPFGRARDAETVLRAVLEKGACSKLKQSMPYDLSAAALQTVTDNGFHPNFPPEALAELKSLVPTFTQGAVDQRDLLWSSIDNDTSRDLDQIEVAEQLSDGRIKVLVGIADVDAYVCKGLALDAHAQSETT